MIVSALVHKLKSRYAIHAFKLTSLATTEWQTVCSKQAQQDFDTQSFMLGKLAGAFIFGAMSDAMGRFKTYFISIILQLATGVLIAIAPNWIVYSVARFAEGY